MAESVYTGQMSKHVETWPRGGHVSAAQHAEIQSQARIHAARTLQEIDASATQVSGSVSVQLADGTVVTVSVNRPDGMPPSVHVKAVVPQMDAPYTVGAKLSSEAIPQSWVPPLFLAFGKWAIDFVGYEADRPWIVSPKPREISAVNAWNAVCVGTPRAEGAPYELWLAEQSTRRVTMYLELPGGQYAVGGYGAQVVSVLPNKPEGTVPVFDIDGQYHEYPIRAEDEEAQNQQQNTQEWEYTYGMLGARWGLNGLTFGVSLDGRRSAPNHKIARTKSIDLPLPDWLYWRRDPKEAGLLMRVDSEGGYTSLGLGCVFLMDIEADHSLVIKTGRTTKKRLHHYQYTHYFKAVSQFLVFGKTFHNSCHGVSTRFKKREISIWNSEAAFYGELVGIRTMEVHTLWMGGIINIFLPWCWFDTTHHTFISRRRWNRVVIFDDVEIPVDLPVGRRDEVYGYLISSTTVDEACIVAIEVVYVDPDPDVLSEEADAIAERLVKSINRTAMINKNQASDRRILDTATKTSEVTYWAIAEGQATNITDEFNAILDDVGVSYEQLRDMTDDVRPVAALRSLAAKREAIPLDASVTV